MGKFSPGGKVSDFLTHMAEEIKKEEASTIPCPLEIPADPTVPVGTPTTQFLEEPTPELAISPVGDSTEQNQDQEHKAGVEQGDEVNYQDGGGDGEGSDEAEDPEETVQEPVEERSAGKDREVIDVEEGGSDEDRETLNERAARSNLRAQRRLETEEPRSLREEAAILADAKREAAERKRKGKQVATPSKNRKPRQASLSVVIQEPVSDRTKEPHYQEEESEGEGEENEGVYEKLEVELDQKLLEAMVYFKDPK